MKEDSESHVSHNLKAKTSCDRQTNVTRLNFSTPLVGRCKLFTLLFLSVTKTEFQARNLSRQVMRIKKISVRGLIVDSITNSLNWHYKNSMADDRDNCCGDPECYRVKASCHWSHETNADVTINSIDSIRKPLSYRYESCYFFKPNQLKRESYKSLARFSYLFVVHLGLFSVFHCLHS